MSLSEFSSKTGITYSLFVKAWKASQRAVIVQIKLRRATIPMNHQRRGDRRERTTSTTLMMNHCFMYLTTNGVRTFMSSGTKKTRLPSTAASFSWPDRWVSIILNVRNYSPAFSLFGAIGDFGPSFSVLLPSGFLSSVERRGLIADFSSPRINASAFIEFTLQGTK